MKYLHYFLATLCVATLFISCGGGDGDSNDVYSPQTYVKSVAFSSDAAESVFTFEGTTAKLSPISGSTEWLSIEGPTYTSGVPSIKLIVKENLTLSDRTATLTAITAMDDKFIIYVRQQAHPAETNTGADGVHDNESSQPAYVPRR